MHDDKRIEEAENRERDLANGWVPFGRPIRSDELHMAERLENAEYEESEELHNIQLTY